MYQRILVPIDGSSTSAKGLDEAVKLAKLTGASLRLIHVNSVPGYLTGFEPRAYAADMTTAVRRYGEDLLEQGKARVSAAGVQVDTVLGDSFPGRISEFVVDNAKSWNADLIVIGTHGRRGVGRMLMGSDAEQIARSAPVPVLLVRASDEGAGRAAEAGTAKQRAA